MCAGGIGAADRRQFRRGFEPRGERRLAELGGRKNVGARPVAARRVSQHEAVARPVRRGDPAVADLHRLLDEVGEVLERIFEPLDLGQRARHVHAHLEEGVPERHRNAHLGGEPADAHDVGHLPVHIEDVGAAREHQRALAGSIEVFAGVDEPMEIRAGWITAPDRPGHGLVLSETARRDWSRPNVLAPAELGEAPFTPRLKPASKLAAIG